jgi:hypothetical protein
LSYVTPKRSFHQELPHDTARAASCRRGRLSCGEGTTGAGVNSYRYCESCEALHIAGAPVFRGSVKRRKKRSGAVRAYRADCLGAETFGAERLLERAARAERLLERAARETRRAQLGAYMATDAEGKNVCASEGRETTSGRSWERTGQVGFVRQLTLKKKV